MGGTDDPSNLVELTIEEHAEAHKKLWEEHGRMQDWWAWRGLAGLMSKEDIVKELLSEAGKKSGVAAQSAKGGKAVWKNTKKPKLKFCEKMPARIKS